MAQAIGKSVKNRSDFSHTNVSAWQNLEASDDTPSQGGKCMHMEIQYRWFQRAGAKEGKSQCLEVIEFQSYKMKMF